MEIIKGGMRMSKLQLHVVKWTVICTIPATVLAAVLFKLAGVDDQGWGGGIGAAKAS